MSRRPHDVAREIADEYSFTRLGYNVLLEAYTNASSAQWRRRAAQLEAARPRPCDYTGAATVDDIRAQWDRLTAAAVACRRRAELLDIARAEFDETLQDLGAA